MCFYYFLSSNCSRHCFTAHTVLTDDVLLAAAREHGNPPAMLVDLRPLSYPMLVILNHELAEQITKPSPRWSSSTPKSPTIVRDIWPLTGHHSILTAEGEHWRTQRRRLNPGFAPQHLLTMLPIIFDKAKLFLEHLDKHAASGDEFSLDQLCTNLTFDIIGAVTMGRDLKAQVPGQQDELLFTFLDIVNVSSGRENLLLALFNFRKKLARRRLANRLDKILKSIVQHEYAAQASSSSSSSSLTSRSVLALSLNGITALTPDLLQQTSDNLRVFLFAGHDTTSILMQWALYELSRSPTQRAALIAELDAVFGADDISPAAIRTKLLAQSSSIPELPYLSAVIRETLRLHPPAATVRLSPPGTDFRLPVARDHEPQCVDNMIMYISSLAVQRDHSLWGDDADLFVPERWLGDRAAAAPPPGAWRPFERGPRSCIGLELANLEAKVILALVVRRYDFAKVGLGELVVVDDDGHGGRFVLDEKGYYRTKSELFNVSEIPRLDWTFVLLLLIGSGGTQSMKITAKPVDGTMMKVKLTERAAAATTKA